MDMDCQLALDDLKSKLCMAPDLVFPNFERPFAIHTGVRDVGLGADLIQTDEWNTFRTTQ